MNKYKNKLTDLLYYGNIDLVIENNEELQNKGYKKYQIAKILNCSKTTIWKRLKEVV